MHNSGENKAVSDLFKNAIFFDRDGHIQGI